MASSSGSAAATYQVFLSFRGPDTRLGFTDVLYHALVDAGVRVFRDNEEIRKGEEIGGEILRAIEESEIFLPIFSRGYASSKWCLLELTKMVESMKGSSGKKKILPVFYDVGVDDVKLKTDLYTEALKEHSKRFGAEIVNLWEEALQQSGKFKGWELKDKGLAELAKLVVRDVSMKLKVKHKCVTEYLVQRDDQVEALIKLLDCDSPEVRFVGISGMGGIGKTTLAKVVFNKLCDRFDGCSFLANVRESSGQHEGIESLQKQLLESLGVGSGNITDVGDGIIKLRTTFGSKKVLIVLDDVDSKDQIRNLAGDVTWFGPGARVFITTRDQSVLEIRGLGIQTLEVEELKPKEASRLFCMHAFGKDSPPDDYLSLSMEAVQSTGGLPLALAVIGSFLGDQPLQEWPDTIERLKKVPHKDVQKQLMISYEALSHETKQIFLDIACFFIGEEKTYPIYMWQACDFDPRMGLKELIYMSLVRVIDQEEDGEGQTLWMHDQLRDLGRAIVNRKSFEDGVKPSRLWFREDASKTLLEERGIEQVEMLRFDHGCRYTFIQKEISSLRKLRYLECPGAKFSGELTNAFPKLRWLPCRGCPPEFMGTGIFLRNLVILDLSNSDIDENWSGWIQIGVGTTLKVLDLSNCYKLRRTPDLSAYSSLERLVLEGCSNLVEIDPSIGKLARLRHLSLAHCSGLRVFPDTLGGMKSLVELDLSYATRVAELPDTIGQLVKLEVLSLRRCQNLEKLPVSIGNMKSLVKLDLSETVVAELPDAIGQLVELQVLSLRWCYCLKKLPVSVGNMKSLVKLDLSHAGITELPYSNSFMRASNKVDLSLAGCFELRVLPDTLGGMKSLVELDLSWTGVAELPDAIGQSVELQVLSLSHCRDLKKLPVSIGNMKSLVKLNLSWTGVAELPDAIGQLVELQVLSLRRCRDLKKLPVSVGNMKSLVKLDLLDSGITELPYAIGNLENIRKIDLRYTKIEELPSSLGMMKRLEELHASSDRLEAIPSTFEGLTCLRVLKLKHTRLCLLPAKLPAGLTDVDIESSSVLWRLPEFSNLQNLFRLVLQDLYLCESGSREVQPIKLEGIGKLHSLVELELRLWNVTCIPEELSSLPHLQKLTLQCPNLDYCPPLPENLHELEIRFCDPLEARPALSHLKKLKKLSIKGAENLVEISELDSLQELSIVRCGIETLPDMSKLKMLRSIHIYRCRKFKGIAGISELESLEHLRIKRCGFEDVDIKLPPKTQEESRKRAFEDLSREFCTRVIRL